MAVNVSLKHSRLLEKMSSNKKSLALFSLCMVIVKQQVSSGVYLFYQTSLLVPIHLYELKSAGISVIVYCNCWSHCKADDKQRFHSVCRSVDETLTSL